MPTIRIQALSPTNYDIGTLLTECTAAAAKALDIPPDWIWALFQPVAVGEYAEGARLWNAEETRDAAVLISITALEGRTEQLKAAVLTATATTTARYLGIPLDKVFAEYRDIPKGHAFSGGEIV